MLRSEWARPRESAILIHGAAARCGCWYEWVNHPLVTVLHKQQRHSNHGRLPVKQHNMFTVIPLASPLHREELRSIVRLLERVMGTLHKVDERGQNDCCRFVSLEGWLTRQHSYQVICDPGLWRKPTWPHWRRETMATDRFRIVYPWCSELSETSTHLAACA